MPAKIGFKIIKQSVRYPTVSDGLKYSTQNERRKLLFSCKKIT